MAIVIEAYEDWGPAVNGAGTNRTLITNCNLSTKSDPAQNYYLWDIPRPVTGSVTASYKRYISFKISGTYTAIKNLKIKIPAAQSAGNWEVAYALTNTYSEPAGVTNEFGKLSGLLDTSLNILAEPVVLYPTLSSSGPNVAGSRAALGPNLTLWTQYLVLQFRAYPSVYTDVGNFGAEEIELLLDELET